MSKLKQILTLFLGRGINTVVNILFMPYLARALSYQDYGTYGQVLLSTDIIKTILSGGLATIIFVFLANSLNKQKKIISSNLFISFLIGILAYLLIVLFSGSISSAFSNPRIEYFLHIYGISLIFSLMNSSLGSVMIYYKKVRTFTLMITISNLLKLLLLVIAIQIYKSLYLVFIILIAIQIVQFIWGAIVLKKRIIIKKINVFNGLKQLKSGFALSIMSVLGFLILYSDGLMVSNLLTVKDYAIYRIGAIEVPLISLLYLSIAQIILPKITQLYSNNEINTIINLKNKIVINSAVIIFPIAVYFIIFSKEFILAYMSVKYLASSVVFMVFTFTLFIRINDYLDVLIAGKKNKLIVIIHAAVFLLNIILNYILIKEIGFVGAAVATVISLYVYAGTFLFYTAKTLKTSIKSIFNYIRILHILLISSTLIIPFYLMKIFLLKDNLFLIIALSLLYYPITYYILYKLKFSDSCVLFHPKTIEVSVNVALLSGYINSI